MSQEKRLVLFIILSALFLFGMPVLMEKLGLAPPEPAPPQKPAAKAPVADGPRPAPVVAARDQEATGAARERPAAVEPARIALVPEAELVLGSPADKSGRGYRLLVQLSQQGAGVDSVTSSLFEAEWKDRVNSHRPLALIARDPKAVPSFAINLVPPDTLEVDAADDPKAAAAKVAARAKFALDAVTWEVERDDAGRVVREAAPRTKGGPKGQEIRFHTTGGDGVAVTKTYRLYPGEDSFDLVLQLASPAGPQTVSYNLIGPHGIPIEGEWYTSTFRDLFIAQRKPNGSLEIVAYSGYDVAKKGRDNQRLSERPLRFAGVENQYFAVFIEPEAGPDAARGGWVAGTMPLVIHDDQENRQRADISVELTSKDSRIAPGHPEVHAYKVFAGPKTYDILKPFEAQDLASYRKGWQIPLVGPLATELAKHVIAPLLDRIYALTGQVARFFRPGSSGSYGIAIILLTITVRLMLFPLGRKAAIAAKKMQALQPQVTEIREKFKGDNEKILREQQALYRKHNVSMFGGCLPALIQLPIFIGLWQALNNSVALRHAPFLWIQNLAAPDMLFKFPMTVPYLGDYFNLLPFVVVGLMLVQNKLFMPPATTPEAEMQQKMMKYMMVVMAFMFYKVPSGLGIYFITSSLWAIGERLLLPKVVHTPATALADGEPGDGKGGGGPDVGKGGSGGGNGASGGGGWLSKKLEKLLEEAAKERTIRNNAPANPDRPKGDRGKGPDRPRSRPGRRR